MPDARANSDIEQVMRTVRKIEDPEHGHFPCRSILNTSHLAVKPASAKLRFAFRVEIHVIAIFLEDLDDSQQLLKRFPERSRGDEIEIVRRGVVLGIASVRCAHKASNR